MMFAKSRFLREGGCSLEILPSADGEVRRTMIVLSHVQASELLEAFKAEKTTTTVSLDLGLTTVEVGIHPQGVRFPDGQRLGWDDVATVNASEVGCFLLEGCTLCKIQAFSETTNRPISLMPTTGAPTLLLAGFPMHRIKGIDPYRDTHLKVKTIAPLVGRVLDTATGLGYTAIEAARTAESVVTVELDPMVLEIARLNPWSRALFARTNIEQRIGDSYEVVQELEGESFQRILHDPPTFSLAGDLFSADFYRQLHRVLARGGRLFHYIGDLESRSGRRVCDGVIRRLREVGFSRVQRAPEAFGLTTVKGRS
jgi:predicted methyltransferase